MTSCNHSFIHPAATPHPSSWSRLFLLIWAHFYGIHDSYNGNHMNPGQCNCYRYATVSIHTLYTLVGITNENSPYLKFYKLCGNTLIQDLKIIFIWKCLKHTHFLKSDQYDLRTANIKILIFSNVIFGRHIFICVYNTCAWFIFMGFKGSKIF